MLWSVRANVTRVTRTYSHLSYQDTVHSAQIPSFVLNGQIQGIVSAEHACKIVKDIIDPFKLYECDIFCLPIEGT